ncbi:hypothetical protein PCE1_002043 [Barthelona sp. PCE]
MNYFLLLCLVSIFSIVATRDCQIYDYKAQFSDCSVNSRYGVYHWIEPKECTAGVTLPESFSSSTCTCTIHDYEWEYGVCDSATHTTTLKIGAKKTDCTGDKPSDITNVPCPCTRDDIQFTVSECNPSTHKQMIVFYFDPTVQCKHDASVLPDPIEMDCDFTCANGTRLDVTGEGVVCTECESGTFSLGGGVVIDDFPDTLSLANLGFQTKCIGDNCGDVDRWAIADGHIYSGNNTAANVDNELIYTVTLRRPGFVRFEFTVEGEEDFDGLYFEVDGVSVMALTSVVYVRKTVEFELSEGPHTLKWVYHNDASMSVGANSAEIYAIYITGTSLASYQCHACPVGTYSSKGSNKCTKCPLNEYADVEGTKTCKKCADDEYSLPGSETCTTRAACVASDYEVFYTSCQDSKRTKYYKWLSPHICNNVTGVNLPVDEPDQECLPCNPGYYWKAGECKKCATGTVSTGGRQTACSDCSAGTFGQRSTNFTFWEEFPEGAYTHCYPNNLCGSQGFRLRNTFVDSGTNHMEGARSYIMYSTTIETAGKLSFNYYFDCRDSRDGHDCARASALRVYAGNGRSRMLPSRWYAINTWMHFEIDLPEGLSFVYFVWEKGVKSENELTDSVRIANVVIQGDERGGGVECKACAGGSISGNKASVCDLCPAGKHSSEDKKQCIPCTKNKYADTEGLAECMECGTGTVAPVAGSDHCTPECELSLTKGGKTYDYSFRAIDDQFGPVIDQGEMYYVSLCDRNTSHFNNNTCVRNGVALQTYACMVSSYADTVYDLGHEENFRFLDDTDPTKGLKVSFSRGDAGCYRGGYRREMHIDMICDLDAGYGAPSFNISESVEYAPCKYQLEWKTAYACPLCTDDMLTKVIGECIHGKRSVSWRPKGKCHSESPVYFENCSGVSISIWTIIFVVMIVFILGGLIAFYIYRNRSITAQYKALRLQSEGNSMGMFNATLIDDDSVSAPQL